MITVVKGSWPGDRCVIDQRQGFTIGFGIRWFNTHEEALRRARFRLEAGRPIPAWAVRQLLARLGDLDKLQEKQSGRPKDRPYLGRVEAVLLQHQIGEVGTAELSRAMSRALAHSSRVTQEVYAFMEEAKRSRGQRKGAAAKHEASEGNKRTLARALRECGIDLHAGSVLSVVNALLAPGVDSKRPIDQYKSLPTGQSRLRALITDLRAETRKG